MVETSNIKIINPNHITSVHVYPFQKNGVDNLGINISLVGEQTIYMNFINKDEAESSLREVYASMTHNQPLFVIQYQRDCCGETIKSDKAMVGGINLTDVQEALENLKVDKK